MTGGCEDSERAIMTVELQSRECNASRMACAFCGTSLTAEHTSREHVLPNALGGRKTVSNFICVDCNSRTGAGWDKELVQQLRPLCTMLNVNRARGKNQHFVVETTSDRNLVVKPDGSMTIATPVFNERKLDNESKITIRARTMAELKTMVSGLKRNYPQIDVDEAMKKAERIREYSAEPYAISLNVGGLLAGRSIIKSCLAMVYDAGFDISHCKEAELYLLKNGMPCFGYFNERDVVKNRPEKVFFHCVHVRGDPERRQMLAYVEYFGWLRIIACLSNSYAGEVFSHCYAVDPVSGRELDLDIELDVERGEMSEIYDYRKVDHGKAVRALSELVGAWRETDLERARAHAIDEALKFAYEECGIEDGDVLSDEQTARFARVFSHRFEPYLVHMLLGSRLTAEDLREIKRKSTTSPRLQ